MPPILFLFIMCYLLLLLLLLLSCFCVIIITIIIIIIIIINIIITDIINITITINIIIIENRWNENNHVSIQHINLYKLSEVTASIIKYTSILIVNCLQELINNLLNLQIRYPIATNKSHQNFIRDIVRKYGRMKLI